MKALKIICSLDDLTLEDEAKEKSVQEIVCTGIKNIILTYGASQRGLDEEERRKYYKIADVFDIAIKEGKEEVELEDAWIGFIRKCKREGKLIPSKFLQRVEELIDEVKDR